MVLRERTFGAIAVSAFTVAAAAFLACSSDDGPPGAETDLGDAAAGRPRDGGGGLDGGAAADATSGDACAAAAAGEGVACSKDEDCTCNTVCAAKRCVKRSACDEALIAWDGPTSNLDGTCLVDLGGFMVQLGQTQGGPYARIDAGSPCAPGPTVPCGDGGSATQLDCAFRVGPLDAGTWYFVVSAYTEAGVESPVSSEVSKTVACP